MNTEIKGLTVFPTTKTGIKSYAEAALNEILDGYVNPLEIKVRLTAMKAVIDEIEKSEEYKDAVLAEAQRYHKDELMNLYDANICIKENGVKYDYSGCNHPQYNSITEEIERLTARRKSFEKYLQTVDGETDYINPETGEICKIYPPLRTSTTGIAITINK